MKWTEEQENAIYKKDNNILVAAAAGSGKTAVLVERIIQKILKYEIDIDKLLVVTFTNAAASEMRERVLEAIYKKIDEEPENENLQKQIILLGKSNICTIHSFCLDVIKNNFFEIDLSANFRIGSEEEIELLKQEVLEELFEKFYENEDSEFAKLVDTYTGYRGDEPLKELVLKIYDFIQSAPFPKDWLEEKLKMFKNAGEEKDFSDSIWGKILLKKIGEELIDGINSLKLIRNKIEVYPELEKYSATICSDIDILKEAYDISKNSWDNLYDFIQIMKFKSWPRDNKIDMEVKNEARETRDSVKKKVMGLISNFVIYNSKEAYQDLYEMYDILRILKQVIFEFEDLFKERKKERNIIDFHDIEHYALQILVKKDEYGNYVPTEVAKKYREKFVEIAIDEYQDSNEVQEYILSTISRGNNMFMVGDVKQSIYKFRQACPDLFINKYENFSLEGNDKGLKIQLFKNFRSRKNVLNLTNIIFESIMSKELGDIDYTEEEFLNFKADYEDIANGLGNAELHIINCETDTTDYVENVDNIGYNSNFEKNNETNVEEDIEDLKQLEKDEIEAKFVAKKIQELLESKVQIKDKKLGYRNVTYKDIVILLRSPSKISSIYEKELLSKNIPVFSDCSNAYLDTIEIQTIINLLKILDNPINDIPLVSVLRSEIGKFTDNELLEIRLCNKQESYYQSLIDAKEKLKGNLQEKVSEFLDKIEKWRQESDYLSLAELIWKIYIETGFYNYVGLMPNGALRQANLKMLFERAKEYEKSSFKGLFNFIKFIEKLKLGNSDMSAAKIIGENEDVVRIMSIHKSKGLEFPIVFLSNSSKRINLMDLNSNMLLHQTLGIGPKYINYDRRIEYSTTAREAIKIISKEEAISEEMRVLYVALTRAKEKLFITGVSNKYQKEIEKKKQILKMYQLKNNKLNPILMKKYISYLDWIELVLLSKDMDKEITVFEHKKTDILKKEDVKEIEIREFDFEEKCDFTEIEKKLNWEYPNLIKTKLPIKSTVSKIKQHKTEETPDFEDIKEKLNINIGKNENINQDIRVKESLERSQNSNNKVGIENIVPEFMKKSEEISGSRKGTLMHLFLQKISWNEEYTREKLEELKEKLVSKKIITLEEAKFIKISKIENFLKSGLANKIKKGIQIEKEKPFCMKLSAKELLEEAKDQEILVQGIIDLYAINEKDEIILVDYKTDFAEKEQELVKKYEKQLNLYKKALEEGTNKKVKEVYIYSLYLEKEIKLEI